MTNSYLPVLLALALKYGGNVYKRAPHRSANTRTLYDWKKSGKEAAKFLRKIRKHMVEKGVQADLALSAREYSPSSEKFNTLVAAMAARKRVDHGA